MAKFRGRPVKEIPDDQVFALIKRLVAECDLSHQCRMEGAPLPSRLIDVGRPLDSGSFVNIIDIKEGTVSMSNYTALCYSRELGIRRDLAGPTKLSSKDSTRNITGLPRVFQDAAILTRRLGVRYLWIDALCIPDDQFDSFERDSVAFANIYKNAYLTLAATGAESDSQGLLMPRTPMPYVHIPHKTSDGTSGELWLHRLPLDKEFMRTSYVALESEPLFKGAWAFQERVLSSRTVHFASDQIYFECARQFVSEDGLLMNQCLIPAVSSLPSYVDRDWLNRWSDIVWHYGTCNLIEPLHKLPALSNIAKAFRGTFENAYLAGLWKSSLIECLCWQSVDCKPVSEYRAPSWSWASVDGLVGMGFHTSMWEPMATIHATSVQLQDNSKPFGKVKAAWIKLEAPLVALTVSDQKSYAGDVILQVKDEGKDGFFAGFDTISRVYSNSYEALRHTELFVVLLAETRQLDCAVGECGSEMTYHGILVTPTSGKADVLERIGFVIADPEEFGSQHLSSRKSITLI